MAQPVDRRQFLIASLASTLAGPAAAEGGPTVYIADMHAHLFFFGPRPASQNPLARAMAAGNVTLFSWSLVGDVPWLKRSRRGFEQSGSPKAGEALAWFEKDLAQIKAHIAQQGLKIALTPADLDRALKGEPHVLLSVEGASFVDKDAGQLQGAYDLGIRHVQLVHYIRNPLGDFQTERPEHGGLTDLGKAAVLQCNRLGILVDLAHCTTEAVTQALAIAKAPLVWSHSSVTRTRKPTWSMPVNRSRQLTLESAKAIAASGGVVGLWSLPSDVGRSFTAYADRMMELADWLGEDHAAFGTDMNAISNPAIRSYADLQRVLAHWRRAGMAEARIRKLAIENYARVLRTAFEAKQT
jgi:membrane dipeptidase